MIVCYRPIWEGCVVHMGILAGKNPSLWAGNYVRQTAEAAMQCVPAGRSRIMVRWEWYGKVSVMGWWLLTNPQVVD